MSVSAVAGSWRLFAGMLIDPCGTARLVARRARFAPVVLAAIAAFWTLGIMTLPRQLALLDRALGATGSAAQDLHYRTMASGLTRLLIADRFLPSTTLLLGAVMLVLLAEPLLALANDRRAALWTLAVLGLAPLLLQGVGDVVLAYLKTIGLRPTPGEALSLASGFKTGPMLLWVSDSSPPHWLVVLDARVNLVTLWCTSLWAVALRTLDGGGLRGWHVGVPLASLAASGVLSWLLGPLVITAILGRP